MNLLLQQIEQHIIDGKPEQFIMNCLQAVGIKFIEAVKSNLPHIVQFMIEHGADVHAYNDWALTFTIIHGHLEVVKLLISAGANIRVISDSALRWTSREGHLEVVKLLKEVISNESSVTTN